MEIKVNLDEYELRLIRTLLKERQDAMPEYQRNAEWFNDIMNELNPFNEKI